MGQQKLVRPAMVDEEYQRAIFTELLEGHPLYSHRLCTRARNIAIAKALDASWLALEAIKAQEREDISPPR